MQNLEGSERTARPGFLVTGVLLALVLIAAACGGSSSSSGDNGSSGATTPNVTKAPSGAVTPGGKLTYGLEAETSGFNPTTDRWAISGNDVAFAIYDPLSAYDADSHIQPYLAQSFESSNDYKTWTITLRPGVKFHDGTDLTAQAVVQNLQGIRESLLTGAALKDIDTVTATNPTTVTLTMKKSWASFPTVLVGQAGIVAAPAQLNADSEAKSRHPIGTGPFVFDSWVPDSKLVAKKNTSYWMKDEQGNAMPYLDEVEFRPIPDSQTRSGSLIAGDLDVLHTSNRIEINKLIDRAQSGEIQAVEDKGENEEAFLMLNANKPPFDNHNARQAVKYATDVDAYINTFQIPPELKTNSAFGKDSPYYSNPPYPAFDLEQAKQLTQQYKTETGQDLAFTLGTTTDPTNVQAAQLLQQMYQAAGMQVEVRQSEQSQYIVDAVQGNYQANLWRQFGSNDPDGDYVWWHKDNISDTFSLNIAEYSNDELSAALDQARATPDEATRKQAYATVQRIWAEDGPYVWLSTTTWLIAANNSIRDFWNNKLPNEQNVAANPAIPYQSGSHRLTGTWIDRG